MKTIVNGHREAMGQTGAGIEAKQDIDMSRKNSFTNVWGKSNNILITQKKTY